jgi:uncharacterized protein DUF5060/collagenase-like protein with putative collagen-binding domain/uncharacterized protein DUF4038
MARKLSLWGGILLLLAAYVMLANDGRHHWHEFRDLYSATFYSTVDLMQGVFDAGPSPLRTPQEVAAWYSTKLFHIYLLQRLVNVFGTGLTSFHVLKVLYVGMLLVGVGLIGITLLGLGASKRRAALIIGLLIFSPGIVYLGFKLMPEAPALLFASAALALFTQGIGSPSRQMLLSSLAGLALAVSALASWTVPFLFFGFWSALALLGMPTSRVRKPMALASVVTWTSFAASLIIGLWLLGGSLAAYVDGIAASFSFTKPLAMWMFAVFNVGLLGMGLWLLVPLAWMSPDGRTRRFFVVWLALSALPVLVLTAGFMEPRYLTAAIVPFVGLAALGAEGLWESLRRWAWRPWVRVACMAVVCVIVLGGTAAAQSLMPYEADTKRLIQAVQAEAPSSDSTVIFVPWNYSDFHFLRFAFPERLIYLVQSAATESGELVQDPEWAANRAVIYGDHFLADAEAFTPLSRQRLLYIGWTILPSLQNLHDLVRYTHDLLIDTSWQDSRLHRGLRRPLTWLEQAHFRNHMVESWLWQNPQFPMRELARHGQYRIYEIKPKQLLRGSRIATSQGISAKVLEVPLWGMFETTIANPRSYANPFVDTELLATFTSPSGKTFEFFGFFDGDGRGGQLGDLWKLRFMCTERGVWSWSATFIDEVPGSSGSFHCVDSSLPGPLRVDAANPRWLKHADGNHFFPRWYYLHTLLFIKEGGWQQEVENLLVRHDYNMVTLLTTMAEGFVKANWQKQEYEEPLFYPWMKDGKRVCWNTFNLSSWQKLDRVLRYLQERRIYVYFFDGFFPNGIGGFPDDPFKEALYLRYALARIGVYWNVVHNIAYEFSEFMPTSRVKRIGRFIKNADPFDLLLTVHDTQEFQALVQSEAWLDFANLQYDAGRASSASITNPFILANFFGKPVSGTEVVWEGSLKINAEQVRRGAWGILTAGGFLLYGEFDINRPGAGDFGAGQAHPYLKILYDLVERIPYWTMAPHNDLVSAGAYCLADPGKEYVIYAERGGPIAVDLSAVQGVFQAEWLNPRTGERTTMVKVKGGTRQTFMNPAGDDHDWVLQIHSLS